MVIPQPLRGWQRAVAETLPPDVQIADQRPAELVGVPHQVGRGFAGRGSSPDELPEALAQRLLLAAVRGLHGHGRGRA